MHADVAAVGDKILASKVCVTTGGGPEFPRLVEAIDVMRQIGIPITRLSPRSAEKMAFALLAVADLPPGRPWAATRDITSHTCRTRQIIVWARSRYGDTRSEGSYDYVLRNDLDLFLRAGYVQNTGRLGGLAYNDSTRAYGLKPEVASLLRLYGSEKWNVAVSHFMGHRPLVSDSPAFNDDDDMIVSGITFSGDVAHIGLGPGGHNALIKRSVEDFLSVYGHDARLLYVGSASDRDKFRDTDTLEMLGVDFEDVLPDVVALSADRGWLFIIEAVHSRGPVSHSKHERFQQILSGYEPGVVYVTTFLDRAGFRKVITEIAWETEVWIAEEPDHLVHFNGDRFLGPHPPAG